MKSSSFFLMFMAITLLPFSLTAIEGSGTITIGKKTSTNCSGFGICNMSASKTNSTESTMSCVFKHDEVGRTFSIEFSHTELISKNPSKLEYFQNKTVVSLEEDFVVPTDVQNLITAKNAIILKKGNYKLSGQDGKYTITISY